MTKTAYAESMARVTRPIATHLKTWGFGKRRHTFNRHTQDGLVDVVNLQMGTHPVGEQIEGPGLGLNLYGKFTVNLGVFVPELYREMLRKDAPAFVNEYDCSLRTRFSNLIPTRGDLWWDLGSNEEAIASEIVGLLEKHGLPFFAGFASRNDIVQRWPSLSEEKGLSARSYLDVALILQHLGRSEEAASYFQTHLAGMHHPEHVRYCEELATKYGWPLAPRTLP